MPTPRTAGTRPATRRFAGEVAAGFAALGRGVRLWGTSPLLMLLGALPALIVGTVFLGLWIWLVAGIDTVARLLTPFAGTWDDFAREALRVLVGVAVVLLAGALFVLSYVAVTLAVGDPFYERISRRVEQRLGDPPLERDEPWLRGLGRAVLEGVRLVVPSVLLGVVVFLIGFVPVVGAPLAVVVGVLIGGRLLAVELTGYAFEARGRRLKDRRRVVRRHRVRTGVFGGVCYLAFLIPVVSVFAMPVAVAGATVLARGMFDEESTATVTV